MQQEQQTRALAQEAEERTLGEGRQRKDPADLVRAMGEGRLQ